MNNKLEIGILVDNCSIPSWEYEAVKELNGSSYSTVSLIIKSEKSLTGSKYKAGRGSLPYSLHQRIDELIFLGKENYAVRKPLCALLKDVPLIRVNPSIHNGYEYINNDDINEIRKFNLDIIIKLGYGLIKGEILRIPAYGVLSFSMKNFPSVKEETTGYYEIVQKNPVTVSELSILEDYGEKKRVINRLIESTCSYSISLNREKLCRRSSFILPGIICGIHSHGIDYLEKLEKRFDNEDSDLLEQLPLPSFYPSMLNLAGSMLIVLKKVFKKILFTDPFSWILLFKISKETDFLRNRYESFTHIKPSADKFWADPFVINKEDRFYIFVEEFIYSRNKAHISVLEIDNQGFLRKVQKVIEKPYHISYPFVFETDDSFYMIPETGSNRTIDLYKCTGFPGDWMFVKSIMENVNAVDSTLFHHNSKWWLFTVIDRLDWPLEASPELYIFYSDDFLSGNWTGHPMNPVVSDARSARPAGKIFIREGRIYRPSQDCAGRYGNSFNINEIITLTETDYREERVLKVRPGWDKGLKGTHTFNSDGGFTIIDAYSFRRRFFKNGRQSNEITKN